MTRFWNHLYQIAYRQFGKPILKILVSNKTKGPKHDIQNQPRSHLPDMREDNLSLLIIT